MASAFSMSHVKTWQAMKMVAWTFPVLSYGVIVPPSPSHERKILDLSQWLAVHASDTGVATNTWWALYVDHFPPTDSWIFLNKTYSRLFTTKIKASSFHYARNSLYHRWPQCLSNCCSRSSKETTASQHLLSQSPQNLTTKRVVPMPPSPSSSLKSHPSQLNSNHHPALPQN